MDGRAAGAELKESRAALAKVTAERDALATERRMERGRADAMARMAEELGKCRAAAEGREKAYREALREIEHRVAGDLPEIEAPLGNRLQRIYAIAIAALAPPAAEKPEPAK